MLHRIPTWFQNLFPGYIWNKKTGEKIIYITFDDGPIPHITEWVLEVLEQYNIKATFFVVGENVARHPHLIKKIKMGIGFMTGEAYVNDQLVASAEFKLASVPIEKK